MARSRERILLDMGGAVATLMMTADHLRERHEVPLAQEMDAIAKRAYRTICASIASDHPDGRCLCGRVGREHYDNKFSDLDCDGFRLA